MTFFNTEDKSAIATDLSVKLAKLVVHELDEAANSMPGGIDVKETEDCSTPTASEHKIPDVLTCPPAPRKRKAIFLSMKNIGNDKCRKVNNLFVSSNSGSLLAFDQISCERLNGIPNKKFLRLLFGLNVGIKIRAVKQGSLAISFLDIDAKDEGFQ